MIKVGSKVKLNMPAINKLTKAAATSLEQTAEALHTEIVQAQVIPRRDGVMQGENTFVRAGTESVSEYEDGTKVTHSISKAKDDKVTIAMAGPQVRRLYFHPEYKFNKGPWEETIHHRDGTVSHLTHDGNPNAKGKWFEDWQPGGKHEDFAEDVFKRLYRRNADL